MLDAFDCEEQAMSRREQWIRTFPAGPLLHSARTVLESKQSNCKGWEQFHAQLRAIEQELANIDSTLDTAHVKEKESKSKAIITAKKSLRNVERYDVPELKALEEEIRDTEKDGESMVQVGRHGSQTYTLDDAKAQATKLRASIREARKGLTDASHELLEFESSFPELGIYIKEGLPSELLPLWLTGWSLGTFERHEVFAGPSEPRNSRYTVYKGWIGHQAFAIKEYKISKQTLRTCFREATLLRRMRHPHIVELGGMFEDSDNHVMYLLMPFYSNGQLDEWVQNCNPDATSLRRVLSQVLLALAHLHSHRIVHTDVKPANILITAEGMARLADFNISVDTATRMSATIGPSRAGYTPGFDAPELVRTGATAASDMFAFGATIKIVVAEPDQSCNALVSVCCSKKADQRPSASKALEHAFFDLVLRWRQEQQRICCVSAYCGGEPTALEAGLECSSARGEPHFVCNECFDMLVTKAADEDLRILQKREGRILCPDPECKAPYIDTEIAQHASVAAFEAYNKSRRMLIEQQIVSMHEQLVKERLANELRLLTEMDEDQRKVRMARHHITDDLLTCKCPRCGQAFVDFTGCFALSCSRCQCGFCAWCGADSGGSDAHEHVASCAQKPAGSDRYYGQFAAFEKAHKAIKARKVREYLSSLDEAIQDAVWKDLRQELMDLGMSYNLGASNKQKRG